MRSFAEGTRELEEIVGQGDLVGRLRVDQVYAAVQEVGYWKTGPNAGVVIRHHPKGGQSHALRDALFLNYPRHMRRLAFEPFVPGGLVIAMTDVVEDMSSDYYERAPRDENVLRNSGHPTVEDDGQVVYERPPAEPRRSGARRGGSHFNASGRLTR